MRADQFLKAKDLNMKQHCHLEELTCQFSRFITHKILSTNVENIKYWV